MRRAGIGRRRFHWYCFRSRVARHADPVGCAPPQIYSLHGDRTCGPCGARSSAYQVCELPPCCRYQAHDVLCSDSQRVYASDTFSVATYMGDLHRTADWHQDTKTVATGCVCTTNTVRRLQCSDTRQGQSTYYKCPCQSCLIVYHSFQPRSGCGGGRLYAFSNRLYS